MDKYQEALDFIEQRLEDLNDQKRFILPRTSLNVLQELINNYQDCRNELCLKCGNYKESHLGKCEGCKYEQ